MRARKVLRRRLVFTALLAGGLAAALAFSACDRKKVTELENQIAQLEQESSEMEQYLSDQDQHAIEIANAVDEVLTRVTDITARQGKLRLEAHRAEMGTDSDLSSTRSAILDELAWLDSELEESRRRLDELTAQVAQLEGAGTRQTTRIVQLEKMISTQELLMQDLRVDAGALEVRAATLEVEKTQVEEEKVEVTQKLDELTEEHDALQTQYEELEEDVGHGFVLVGDKRLIKSLKKQEILQDRGKVVVAGSALDSPGVAAEHFRVVSVVAREIRLGALGERVEVLSPHREQGQNFWFERREQDLYLMLRDPARFWNASHYLVVRER